MAERQERIMREDGVGPEEVARLAEKFVGKLRKEGATLGEAKKVLQKMAWIIRDHEDHMPEVLLRDTPQGSVKEADKDVIQD